MDDYIRTTHVSRSVIKHKPEAFGPVWTWSESSRRWRERMLARLLHPAGRGRHGGD